MDSIFLSFNDSDALNKYNEVQYESLYQSNYLDKGYEIIMYIMYHNLIVYVLDEFISHRYAGLKVFQ